MVYKWGLILPTVRPRPGMILQVWMPKRLDFMGVIEFDLGCYGRWPLKLACIVFWGFELVKTTRFGGFNDVFLTKVTVTPDPWRRHPSQLDKHVL